MGWDGAKNKKSNIVTRREIERESSVYYLYGKLRQVFQFHSFNFHTWCPEKVCIPSTVQFNSSRLTCMYYTAFFMGKIDFIIVSYVSYFDCIVLSCIFEIGHISCIFDHFFFLFFVIIIFFWYLVSGYLVSLFLFLLLATSRLGTFLFC